MQKFSSYQRLIRVTALVTRFIDNIRRKKKKEELILYQFVTSEEYDNAEVKWLTFIPQDFNQLKSYKQLKKDLNLEIFDDGLIRCKGRLKNAPVKFDTKFPILLPKDNYFTKLLVKYCHELVLHNGLKETLNELRTKFWIPKARNYIRKILFKCLLCKRHEGQQFTYPSPPYLPRSRLSDAYPFTYTGLDYAGPLYVKSIYGRSDMYKAWIFLFTCASTRGLFLDLVPDCTSASCIRGLRRFFSKRGIPQQIISDNGSQFTATETQ